MRHLHTDGKTKGTINYTVWSDVFLCPECAGKLFFGRRQLIKKLISPDDRFSCPNCNAELNKRRIERAWTTKYDLALKKDCETSETSASFNKL